MKGGVLESFFCIVFAGYQSHVFALATLKWLCPDIRIFCHDGDGFGALMFVPPPAKVLAEI